jgi:hypothetical protein
MSFADDVVRPKVRGVMKEYNRLLNNSHFRRQAMHEIEDFMEGLRSEGVVEDYSFAWIDGSMHCRWKLTGQEAEDCWEKSQ